MTNALPCVLFVDDETIMLDSLRRSLRSERGRLNLFFESDPLRAVERFRSDHFDVVVSDLRMPNMTGLEMIAEMRQHQTADSEFILLTGNADLASAIDAINKTCVFRFLTKPCVTENLIDAVDVALSAIHCRQQQPENMATAALSAMSPAVAVVDGESRIIYYNDSAAEVLKTHRGIVVDRKGALKVNASGSCSSFNETVKKAAEDPQAIPKFISLTNPDDLEQLTAVVTPLGQTRVAVLFTVPGRFEPPSVECLIDLFGLTPVEAVIAQTIANSGTVEEAATKGNVTQETARTYLKRIFLKTGVRRQVDLVQLILTTPATLLRTGQATKDGTDAPPANDHQKVLSG